MDAMSYGEIPASAPLGPGVMEIPSSTYNGSLLPLTVLLPRSRTESPPSAARVTQTPGYFAASWSSIETVGLRAMSSAVTPIGAGGLGVIGSTSPTGAVLGARGAQAMTRLTTKLKR